MESAAGVKGEGHTQTLQNRVRDVFRRGLQWKWDKDSSSVRGSRDQYGESSHGDEIADAVSQRNWPQFAPIAIQKFRRLFSSDGSSHAPSEHADSNPERLDAEVQPCTKNHDNLEEHCASDMVKMKSEDKKGGEVLKLEEEGGGNSLPVNTSSFTNVRFECSSQVVSKETSKKEQDQDCISGAPSTMASNIEPIKSEILESGLSCEQNLLPMKACDHENISKDLETISNNNPQVDCDVDKSELFLMKSNIDSNCDSATDVLAEKKKEVPSSVTCKETASPNVPMISTTYPSLPCNDSIVPSHEGSANPAIVLSTIDADKLTNQHTKRLVEPLYLNIDPSSGAGLHARKSPVTVQEWVDSIPLSQNLEEDPDGANTEIELSLKQKESQDKGDACPLVTVRPSSSQSGLAADQRREAFSRDVSPSLQSDTGSHGSSVDSYLEARRPDPEEVLLGLGFGGPLHNTEAEVSRIPARFLQQSKVKGVAIDDFLRYQQDLIETFESGYSGYRGLTGGGGGLGVAGESDLISPNALSFIPDRFRLSSSASSPAHRNFPHQSFFPESFSNIPSRFLPRHGGAQIPSVIVAKIMEKLREHERESSVKSSAGSSPRHNTEISKRRFSRAAQRVTILTKMKSRDSIASGPQAHSVLNPDNRKFLDNQGSKSPEVLRKRMIIGQRSFTFDVDGQLIETEANSEEEDAPEMNVAPKPPPPRPLVHKDSVLSSATSLSLTSYDSDSETDEACGLSRKIPEAGSKQQDNQPLLFTPMSAHKENTSSNSFCKSEQSYERRRSSLPSTSDFLGYQPSMNLLKNNGTIVRDCILKNQKKTDFLQTSTPETDSNRKKLQRVKSAPSISPVSSVPFELLQIHQEENVSNSGEVLEENCKNQEKMKMVLLNQSPVLRSSKSSKNILKTHVKRTQLVDVKQLSHYEITDFVLPEDCVSPLTSPESHQSAFSTDDQCNQYLPRMFSMPKSSAMYLDKEMRRKLSLNSSIDSYVAKNVAHSPDLKNWSTSSVSSWESEKEHSSLIGADMDEDHASVFEGNGSYSVIGTSQTDLNAETNRRRGSLKRQQKVDEEDSSIGNPPNANLEVANIAPTQGDSFEMEELAVDDDVKVFRTGSAHSDSSGFQEESNAIANKEKLTRASLVKQLSESEPMLYTQVFPDEPPMHSSEHLKRLSLPVIRVQDESGLIQWRASNFCETINRGSLRRVQSLPSQISHLGLGRLFDSISPGSVTDSIGNMFSSCSDESVIHMPRKSVDVTAEFGKLDLLPLPVAIVECEGEVEALRTPRSKSEHIASISQNLETLKEAQSRIKDALLQVQNNLCSSSSCNMSAAIQQVALVIQHQNNLCSQLEGLKTNLLSTVNNQSVQGVFSIPSSSIRRNGILEDSSNLPHSPENCVVLSQVVERENRKLQELVRLNVDELAQLRALFERLLPNVKP
ncbi:Protein TESPA1 [Frankliniella fusca]|uniref:Protein TESPA1 n=1 Tax=Frankliniella fusca TaxID=407009 RepID=A0AAE1HI96_9NEOP|nr:Protein TESPA1 [Frankliniella fusca]